ncbi:ATP-binding cassette domain-containing protein [Rubritalea marina]|uniref:ATP-binding cassette domain-containing protein n=1 Tax=Rubritalea marina TaxID=361055 RepID=UPI000363AC87|nr:ATP-binding cassette domain-containing protein [Rubritalea marina]
MLELENFCFTLEKDEELINLVDRVSLRIPSGHFTAIVGPSGCGKTTLLNTIAGLNPMSEGSIAWRGQDLEEHGDIEPADIGYVPQFSIAYDALTVDESIEIATKLKVKTYGHEDLDKRIDKVLEDTGLTQIADRPVKVLSGGQKRRLSLAMELVTSPQLLLCDEVTSGLDPRSEHDIVRRLHELSRQDGRVVLSVTHSLAHLDLYDSIIVLHEGKLVYHGPPDRLNHYFSVEDTDSIYPKLAKQNAEKWRLSWLKHREAFYQKMAKKRRELLDTGELKVPPHLLKLEDPEAHHELTSEINHGQASEPLEVDHTSETREEPKPPRGKRRRKRSKVPAAHVIEEDQHDTSPDDQQEELDLVETPNLVSQFFTLLERRIKIFSRDRGQLILQAAILLCFPCLVALFSAQGNEPLLQYPDVIDQSSTETIRKLTIISENRLSIGSTVSGIIMFQVVLLALMGSNNAAREIAGERQILEKEKFGGVSPIAYLASKLVFLTCMVLIQSLWMAFFVQFFWPFPGAEVGGGFSQHLIMLTMANAAITSICLGISSLMKTSEQASLLSIYLVGFQLPLSGAVLALPDLVAAITRPFISAYWAWAGSIDSLANRYQAAAKAVTETSLNFDNAFCMQVLGIQIIVGIIAAFIGIKRDQWTH